MKEKIYNFAKIHQTILIFLAFVILGGIIGTCFSVKPSWDFLSYHYYNGWAFLNNRICIDTAPAMFRSYANPLLDVIQYLTIEALNNHPYIYLFLNGTKLGIFIFLSYFLFQSVFKMNEDKFFILTICIFLTIMSPMLMVSMDFMGHDLVFVIITLLGMILFLRKIFHKDTMSKCFSMFFIGLLLGGVVGLKYAMAPFCFGIFACTLIYYKQIEKPLKTLVIIFVGMFLGFLLTNGWWMTILWKYFHNPMFPYFNNIFHSSFCDVNSIYGNEFVHLKPKNIFEFIFGPLQNSFLGNVGFELGYYDLKIPLTFISVIVYLMLYKYTKLKEYINKITEIRTINLIILLTVIIYYTNHFLFGQIRYIISLIPFILTIMFCVLKLLYMIPAFMNKSISPILFVVFLVICVHCNHLNNLGLFQFLGKYFVYLLVTYVILCYTNKIKFLSDATKEFRISACFVSIVIISFIYSYLGSINIQGIRHLIYVKDMKIPDNSKVICGTMLANFIVPKQNPNAQYIGFSLPKDIAEQGFWNNIVFVPFHYNTDAVLEAKVSQILQNETNLYYVYANEPLGVKQYDYDLYIQALARLSNNKITSLDDCKKVRYEILSKKNPWEEIYICKLK